jgi:hypothetical protein
MHTINMITTSQDLMKTWGVYTIYNETCDKLLYIGIEKMTQIFTISQARGNPFFSQVIGNHPFVLLITDIMPNKIAAMNKYGEHIRRLGMPDMIRNHSLHKGVQCINTGDTFRNITECAQAMGIDQGALSRHLRGVAGHNTIKGNMYRRIPHPASIRPPEPQPVPVAAPMPTPQYISNYPAPIIKPNE